MSGKQVGLFQHATSAQSRQTQRAAAFFVRLRPETSPIVSGAGVSLSSMGVTGLNIATVATGLPHESKGKCSKKGSLACQEVTLTIKSTRWELLEQWPYLSVSPIIYNATATKLLILLNMVSYSRHSKFTFSVWKAELCFFLFMSCLNRPSYQIDFQHWHSEIWIKWTVANAHYSLLLSARVSS